MHSTFELDQTIALVVGNHHWDLHNCFDFVGLDYRPADQTARLHWRRGLGHWVPAECPEQLVLSFSGVTKFTCRQRDAEMPFGEDTCVASISFLPVELEEKFDVICPDHRSSDEHLGIVFQSDFGIKIWAESVVHETNPA